MKGYKQIKADSIYSKKPEAFDKLSLESEDAKPQEREKSKRRLVFSKKLLFVPALFVILLFLSAAAVYFPVKNLYLSLLKVNLQAQQTYAYAKNKNLDKTSVSLKELKTELENTQEIVSKLAWTKSMPFLGEYTKDAEHLVKAGIYGVEAGQISVEAISPYSDLLGFEGESSFVSGSAQERIQTAVETLDKLLPKLDELSEKMVAIKEELENVNAEKYPEEIKGVKVKDKLLLLKSAFSDVSKLFVDAKPLIGQLPDILGNKKERRYLVLFQNDAELRSTGGFITAYSLFKIDKGKIQVEVADDIYELDKSKTKTFKAPEPILLYHKDVNTFELRDSNLSPDFVLSMQKFESMLSESVPSFSSYDGIIAIDTHVLVETIKILGDETVYGRVFSAEIDKRCDCPKAIYELEDYATRPVAYIRETRKDIIGTLMLQLMKKALGVSPSGYWGKLFQMFLDEADQKHILFYLKNTDAQKGIEALNWAGRIVPFDGDYLHVNNVNFAGAKSNMFVKISVEQDIELANDGTAEKTVIISYKNPAPPSNCNLEAGQLCLNGILRNWLRIYVPQGSELIEFTGSEMETKTYDDLGKTVFEGFLTVKPQGASSATLRYSLPGNYDRNNYPLLIQKQPGTDDNAYKVNINGKEKANINLLEDQKLTLR